MKNILTLVFIGVVFSVCSQEYEFLELSNLKVKIIVMDKFYSSSIQKNDTIELSYYNTNGKLVRSIHKSNGQIESNSSYTYDSQNTLVEYVDFGRQMHQRINDPSTGKEIETSFYDSTIVLQSKKFSYSGNNIKQIDTYMFGRDLIISEIFDYDKSNRLIKETSINYPDPNTLVYFKPQSTEIDWNHPKQEDIEVTTKVYNYYDTLRICEYYDSTNLVGIDTSVFENNLLIKKIRYKIDGEKIFEEFYKYNDNQYLIEYLTIDSGKSVFGGEYDGMLPEKTIYQYNNDGSLKTEECYIDGSLSYKQKYYYKK